MSIRPDPLVDIYNAHASCKSSFEHVICYSLPDWLDGLETNEALEDSIMTS
jgi:hypothetical protein